MQGLTLRRRITPQRPSKCIPLALQHHSPAPRNQSWVQSISGGGAHGLVEHRPLFNFLDRRFYFHFRSSFNHTLHSLVGGSLFIIDRLLLHSSRRLTLYNCIPMCRHGSWLSPRFRGSGLSMCIAGRPLGRMLQLILHIPRIAISARRDRPWRGCIAVNPRFPSIHRLFVCTTGWSFPENPRALSATSTLCHSSDGRRRKSKTMSGPFFQSPAMSTMCSAFYLNSGEIIPTIGTLCTLRRPCPMSLYIVMKMLIRGSTRTLFLQNSINSIHEATRCG